MARYATAALRGEWTSGNFQGEVAQTQISLVCIDGGGDFPPVINQSLPVFSATASGDYEETGPFRMYYGSKGLAAWDAASQVAIATALKAWGEAVKTKLSTQFSWTSVALQAFESDGSVVNGATIAEFNMPVPGTVTTSTTWDPTNALCASYFTGGRGARNRGRSYMPWHSVSQNSGLVTTSDKNTLGTATLAMHNAVNAIPGVRHAVVSKKYLTYSAIRSIEVGDELDHQQRRRRGRREQYTVFG